MSENGFCVIYTQEPRMDHPTAMHSIEPMGARVIPALAGLR